MSHLVEQMAYAGEVPWHGLGKKVPNDLSAEQMLKAAGLDWEVNKVPAFITIDKKKVDIGRSALVRSSDNTILDVVSKDWNPVQNATAFEFFKEFVDVGDMQMHTAGSLKKGKMVWALAKVNDSFELFGGDKVDSYLMFTNPHEFGHSIDVRFTPIRVVCNNTLTLALSHKGDRVVRHTHRTEFDPEMVKITLGMAREKMLEYKSAAATLGKKRATEDAVRNYVRELFPMITKDKERLDLSKNATAVQYLVENQPGAQFAEGSWWQAFNAATFFIDHKIGKSNDRRVASSWFGTNRALKVKALNKAVEYADTSKAL